MLGNPFVAEFSPFPVGFVPLFHNDVNFTLPIIKVVAFPQKLVVFWGIHCQYQTKTRTFLLGRRYGWRAATCSGLELPVDRR